VVAQVPAEQYPVPPDVYTEEAPQFIYSQPLDAYVAVGVPYDLVYTGGAYFYYYGGYWYRGPYYNGPWVIARGPLLPPLFLRYRIGQIRYYRNHEFRRYQHYRGSYDGRFHRPAYRGRRR
ncbi:MAG TPA: hypothetical protein VK654_05530, partial [Nitrospirota bacterium]|nr:hypothetical protein [Nitrospirota bacterium]